MAVNSVQFNLNDMAGAIKPGASMEDLLKQINEMLESLMGGLDDVMKDSYKKQLNEAATASGGVITARESELIDKAVNGTITKAEEEELIKLFPPNYFAETDLSGCSTEQLVAMLGDTLSNDSAAAATELRLRASVDGHVSDELNYLLNDARLNAGLNSAEQDRLWQLLQSEDAL